MANDELQFETAERAEAFACALCKQTIEDQYFQISGGLRDEAELACTACTEVERAVFERGSPSSRAIGSTVFGVLAGALGCGIWIGVRVLTGFELGLISILVGILVGFAVRLGSGQRGGRGYQLLAVFLTYTAIVGSYAPFVVESVLNEGVQADAEFVAEHAAEDLDLAERDVTKPVVEVDEAPVESGEILTPPEEEMSLGVSLLVLVVAGFFLVLLVYASPFLIVVEDPISGLIGLAIIFFGLQTAWRMNRGKHPSFEGPFPVVAANIDG